MGPPGPPIMAVVPPSASAKSPLFLGAYTAVHRDEARMAGERLKRVRFADPAEISCVEDSEFQIVEQMLTLGVVRRRADGIPAEGIREIWRTRTTGKKVGTIKS